MSLTSFLAIKEVKNLFRQTFEFKPTNVGATIKAPPLTNHHSRIGTAFDYLVRFWLERHYRVAESHMWVAERAAISLSVESGEYIGAKIGGSWRLIPAKEWGDRQRNDWPDGCTSITTTGKPDPTVAKNAAIARSMIDAANNVAAAYVRSGVVGDDLFRSALMLAGLDTVSRTGRKEYFNTTINDDDVKDLRNLWDVLVEGDLRSMKGPVWLNPTFGKASGMVGGADADFIAGNALVDIKTTKNGQFTRGHFNQLVGYCVLDYLGRRRGMHDMRDTASLSRASIYFSRHGVLRAVEVDHIYNAPGFDSFIDEFSRLAKEWYSPVLTKVIPANPATGQPATFVYGGRRNDTT